MSRTPNVPATDQIAEEACPRKERRRHRRHPAEQQIMVYWQGKFGLSHESSAVLRNVSAGGFAIELTEKFEVGSVVVVKADERSLQCMVRHVQQYSDSFLAGLEVLSSSDGSSCTRSLEGLASALADPSAD